MIEFKQATIRKTSERARDRSTREPILTNSLEIIACHRCEYVPSIIIPILKEIDDSSENPRVITPLKVPEETIESYVIDTFRFIKNGGYGAKRFPIPYIFDTPIRAIPHYALWAFRNDEDIHYGFKDSVVELLKELSICYTNRAISLVREGRIEEAKDVCKRARYARDDNLNASVVNAFLYKLSGDEEMVKHIIDLQAEEDKDYFNKTLSSLLKNSHLEKTTK